jgi:hypothetical protein
VEKTFLIPKLPPLGLAACVCQAAKAVLLLTIAKGATAVGEESGEGACWILQRFDTEGSILLFLVLDMEKQPSTRHGALEKLKSFRGLERQRSFKFLSMDKQQSFKRNKDSPGKRGDSALHLAARAGSVAHVQKIFADCDPEQVGELSARQNQDGETALYVSAEKGHVEVVREILKACDVHSAGIKANNSFDAFHIAAKQGHLG